MAPQEAEAVLLRQGEDGLAHLFLGAGTVDDHGVLAELGGQLLHVFDDRLGVGGQQEEIHRLQVFFGERLPDGLCDLGELHDGLVGVPTQNGDVFAAAEGLCHGPADESQANDSYDHPSIASRIRKIFWAVAANSSGV